MGVRFQPLIKSGFTIEKSSGSGDVVGPNSSTTNHIPQFSDNTGKVLKDGLELTTTLGNPGSDTKIPSEKAVRSAISTAGGGDVSGPSSSVDDNFASFNGETGKLVQDSGKKSSDFASASHSHPQSDITSLTTDLGNKVDKVTGKGLSAEDYTSDEKTKLSGIATGAEVNVNADWNATTGDAQILNKPTIPDELADLTADSTHRTVTDTEKSTWNGKQDALGFTAENVANKKTDLTDNSDIYYPSQKAVKTAVDGKLNKSSFTITENTELSQNNSLVICNSSSAITVTLPAVVSNSGLILSIKNINTGIVTIDGNSSETIDEATTIRLENIYDSVILGCNGSAWFILGGKWRQTSFV